MGGPVCSKIGFYMGQVTTHHAGEKESGIERLQRVAAARRPDDRLFSGFLPACYHGLPDFDLAERDDDDLYAVAQAHLNLGRVRHQGETLIRVLSPNRDRDGWSSDRSIVLLVTDDAPFLVDDFGLLGEIAQSELAATMLEGLTASNVEGLAMWPESLRHHLPPEWPGRLQFGRPTDCQKGFEP